MKTLPRIIIAITIILIFTIGAGIYGIYFVNKETSTFQDQIDLIKEKIQQNNWVEANKQAKDMFDKWEKRKLIWSIMLDHRKMDTIESSMVRSKEYVKFKNKQESIVELNLVAQQLMLLEKSEVPTLPNIF